MFTLTKFEELYHCDIFESLKSYIYNNVFLYLKNFKGDVYQYDMNGKHFIKYYDIIFEFDLYHDRNKISAIVSLVKANYTYTGHSYPFLQRREFDFLEDDFITRKIIDEFINNEEEVLLLIEKVCDYVEFAFL